LTEYDYHLITDVRQDTQQATTINKQLTPCSLTDKDMQGSTLIIKQYYYRLLNHTYLSLQF